MKWIPVAALMLATLHAQPIPSTNQREIPRDVVETLILKRVAPKLSPEATKVNGEVLVAVEIDQTGKLRKFTFVKGPGTLREPVAKALFEWRFRPYLLGGVAIPVKSELLFHFGDASARSPDIDEGHPLRKRISPPYPDEAKKARVQGTVRMKVLVGPDGQVVNAVVISGPEVFRQGCLDAVRQWIYEPLVRNGQPEPFETDVAIPFEIFPL